MGTRLELGSENDQVPRLQGVQWGGVVEMSPFTRDEREEPAGAQSGDTTGEQRLRHDLRQSLSLVMLLAAVVERQSLDSPDIRVSLDRIADEVGHMTQVVRGRGRDDEPEVVDVGEVVASIWASAARSQRAQLRLVRVSDAFVRTDRVALGRSIRNLVDNAMRAAGDGVVEVRVVADDDDVVVEVGDNGPGFGLIPAQQCLGLVTVRRFAAASGGGLETGTSHLGGALLRLTMPRVPMAATLEAPPENTRTTA